MNRLVRLSPTGGAECWTDAITLQEAIETMPIRMSDEGKDTALGHMTMVENIPEQTIYLLKDEEGQVIECRGDVELMGNPVISRQIVWLIDSGSRAWQPFDTIIDIIGRKVSTRAREPIPPH